MPRDLGTQRPRGCKAASTRAANTHNGRFAACAGPRPPKPRKRANFCAGWCGMSVYTVHLGVPATPAPLWASARAWLACQPRPRKLAESFRRGRWGQRHAAQTRVLHPSFCTHLGWVVGSTPSEAPRDARRFCGLLRVAVAPTVSSFRRKMDPGSSFSEKPFKEPYSPTPHCIR